MNDTRVVESVTNECQSLGRAHESSSARAEQLIACLEGEIAKRDEVIVGLTNSRDFWREKAIAADDELAAIKAQEPVQVDYVAVMRADGDGGLEVEWLLEGGTAELMNGMYLCCVGGGTLLFEEGSGHLYAAPVYEAKAQGVVMPPSPYMPGSQPTDFTDYELGEIHGRIAMWEEIKRLNAAPAAPAADAGLVDPAAWLWVWLMTYCKSRGLAPATQGHLFESVSDMRAVLAAHRAKGAV